jgi:hypothetical protein
LVPTRNSQVYATHSSEQLGPRQQTKAQKKQMWPIDSE